MGKVVSQSTSFVSPGELIARVITLVTKWRMSLLLHKARRASSVSTDSGSSLVWVRSSLIEDMTTTKSICVDTLCENETIFGMRSSRSSSDTRSELQRETTF